MRAAAESLPPMAAACTAAAHPPREGVSPPKQTRGLAPGGASAQGSVAFPRRLSLWSLSRFLSACPPFTRLFTVLDSLPLSYPENSPVSTTLPPPRRPQPSEGPFPLLLKTLFYIKVPSGEPVE